jgi:hypothetical protein
LTGKVFISSGTHLEKEKDAVRKVQELLKSPQFKLNTYVAIDVQSLGDIMNITQELPPLTIICSSISNGIRLLRIKNSPSPTT